jgi:hypothetical protein
MNISEATPKSQPSTLPSVENPTAAHKAYKNRKNIILLPRECIIQDKLVVGCMLLSVL